MQSASTRGHHDGWLSACFLCAGGTACCQATAADWQSADLAASARHAGARRRRSQASTASSYATTSSLEARAWWPGNPARRTSVRNGGGSNRQAARRLRISGVNRHRRFVFASSSPHQRAHHDSGTAFTHDFRIGTLSQSGRRRDWQSVDNRMTIASDPGAEWSARRRSPAGWRMEPGSRGHGRCVMGVNARPTSVIQRLLYDEHVTTVVKPSTRLHRVEAGLLNYRHATDQSLIWTCVGTRQPCLAGRARRRQGDAANQRRGLAACPYRIDHSPRTNRSTNNRTAATMPASILQTTNHRIASTSWL